MVKQIYKTLMPKRTYIPHHSSGERIHDSSSVQHGWEWYEMTFFVHWKLCENTTIICFNAPEKIRTSLQVTLTSRENDLDCTDPYSIFSFLTWELLTLYDTSVWTLRNHICDWEAVCSQLPLFSKPCRLSIFSIANWRLITYSCTKLPGI
jgi:hypothetical protein